MLGRVLEPEAAKINKSGRVLEPEAAKINKSEYKYLKLH